MNLRSLKAFGLLAGLGVLPLAGCSGSEFFENHSRVVWTRAALADFEPQYAERIMSSLDSSVRTDADRSRDLAVAVVETIGISGLDAGLDVAELISVDGYYTRLLIAMVGRRGHVTVWQPAALDVLRSGASAATLGRARNLVVNRTASTVLEFPSGLDLVFSADGYHEVYMAPFPDGTPERLNAAVFRALRPGGLYVILDHHAAAGSGKSTADRLHRIDVETVKRDVLAAGFILENEAGPAANVVDTGIPAHDPRVQTGTSQFRLRFRKPEQ